MRQDIRVFLRVESMVAIDTICNRIEKRIRSDLSTLAKLSYIGERPEH